MHLIKTWYRIFPSVTAVCAKCGPGFVCYIYLYKHALCLNSALKYWHCQFNKKLGQHPVNSYPYLYRLSTLNFTFISRKTWWVHYFLFLSFLYKFIAFAQRFVSLCHCQPLYFLLTWHFISLTKKLQSAIQSNEVNSLTDDFSSEHSEPLFSPTVWSM